MNLYINNHTYHYELENLTRMFFPNEKIIVSNDSKIFETPYILTEVQDDRLYVKFEIDDYIKETTKMLSSDNERTFAEMLFFILSEYTGITPPWGLLTGVRPIKLFRSMRDENGLEKTEKYFKEKLFVSDDKLELAKITEGNERKILALSEKMSYSLYISIPFCPTRCSYCSFVSQSIEQAKKLMTPYVELLCEELVETAKIAKKLNLKLESVYMGGGTPTSLNAEQLDKILSCVTKHFDISGIREFTVEAGRPDTITKDKLMVIKNCGVDRISINPQTMNDSVLSVIGRKHTSEQTLEAFYLARKLGFNHINTDLIAGLPTETFESFKNSLDTMLMLNADSITVHTLAMKKSSYLTADGMTLYRDDAKRTADMVKYSVSKLTENGYHPYYLYRQSKMLGNLENTGWSKPKKDGYYNVFVMDETHTILACGAGGVTKLKKYDNNYLERIFNFKYPYEYIDRFDEIINRKVRIVDFYEHEF